MVFSECDERKDEWMHVNSGTLDLGGFWYVGLFSSSTMVERAKSEFIYKLSNVIRIDSPKRPSFRGDDNPLDSHSTFVKCFSYNYA